MARLYFDHNATAPMCAEALSVFAATSALPGNPSSIHRDGQQARHVVESSRRTIARLLGCAPGTIVFTSGGTESNDLAIGGFVRALAGGGPKHILTTAIEHPSVLETCRALACDQLEVSLLLPDRNGLIPLEQVERQIRPDTILVSVITANNETGVIQPVEAIGRLVGERRAAGQPVYFHSDGVQAPGRMPIDFASLPVDLFSLSAHKVYGPKGVGALYVREGTPLAATHHGGRHERGRRAGTENVAGIAAFARALEVASCSQTYEHLRQLRDRFEAALRNELPDVEINSGGAGRLPNTSNVRFAGIDAESLVIALDLSGFAVSTGAACSSGSVEPSHVLLAMGRSRAEAKECMRISFGTGNSAADVDALCSAITACVRRQRTAGERGALAHV